MKPKIAILFILILGFSSICIAQNPEQLYQKALVKEEGEGALQEAIAIFAQVADNAEAGNALRAKALLHVGLCYEKLGKQEALKAYQRLVNNYPGQKQEVAIARERMNKLIKINEVSALKPIEPKFTKIRTPFDIPFWSGSQLSPDGKTIVFGSENTLWKVPIPGSVDPGLAGEPKNIPGTEDVLGHGLSWSADGHWLAYNRAFTRDLKGGGTRIYFHPEGAHIEIMPVNGGEIKRIEVPQWIETNGNTMAQLGLSPDGKMVAFAAGEQIYIAVIETGEIKQLTINGGIAPCFSPDGKKVAYLTPTKYQSSPPARINEVWIVSVDGSDPEKVSGDLKQNFSYQGPVWSPDGKMIAFSRIDIDRKARGKIAFVSLTNRGKATGPPVQIEIPVQQSPAFLTGWSRDNKIGMLITTPYREYIYTIPASGGKATQVSLLDELAGIPEWSPNGQRIYFRWKGGLLASVPKEGGNVIVHSGIEKMHNDSGFFSFYPAAGNSISPDGETIVFTGGNATEGPFIYTVPVMGGIPKKIRYGGRYPCWSPDGKWIAFQLWEEDEVQNGFVTLYKIPKGGGEPQKISKESDNVTEGGIDWSLDGKWIAYFSKKGDTRSGTLNLISTVNGSVREVCEIENIIAHNNISWSPDGQQIAFTSNGKIWVVPAEGGEQVEVKTDVDAKAGMLDWSPDGQKIAFSGSSGMKNELWFMEDFLPLERLAQKEEAKELKFQKVLSNTEIEPLGAPSPNGKYISFVDWANSSNLSILDFTTNEKKVVTDFVNDNQQAYYSCWSPDGKRLAYFWWEMGDKDIYNIGVTDVNGTKTKNLFSSDQVNWIELGNWSSDGKYLVATLSLRKTRQCQIIKISVDDRTYKVLKTLDQSYLGGKPLFSPDDRFIAYDCPDKNESGNSNIHILSVNNASEHVLINHPAHDYLLGWTPDERYLLFASDRTGSVDAMIIQVNQGNAIGNPIVVKSNIGSVVPLGFSNDGAFYYGDWPGKTNIFSAELDMENSKVVKAPALLINRYEGRNGTPCYSHNGQYLAYISKRGIINKGKSETTLCVKNLLNGHEEIIVPPAEIANSVSHPVWSPDDKSIALMCRKEGKQSIFNFDVSKKEFRPLVTDNPGMPDLTDNIYPLWSPDGKTLYYFQLSGDTCVSRIMARNLVSLKDKVIFSYESEDIMDRIFTVAISPDGEWISAINRGENRVIKLISTEGKETIELDCFQLPGGASLPQIWTNDGRYILYGYYSPKNRRWDLKKIPLNGGETTHLDLDILNIGSLSLHPDGKTLVFSSVGFTSPKNNIWKIENLTGEIEKIYAENEE